jgi:hypothetical protein
VGEARARAFPVALLPACAHTPACNPVVFLTQASSGSDYDMCWICLEEASEDGSSELMSPCKCPRKVHPQCLARWQLQQAGRHEEKFCR